MTNAVGHRLATAVGDQMTLGAYRRGNRLPWIPGATIDTWVGCPRGEMVTGVPSPHVYFVQTIGDPAAENGSIYCPACRVEVARRRVTGVSIPVASSAPRPAPRQQPPQAALPF